MRKVMLMLAMLAMVLAAAVPALAQSDKDCASFDSQQEAQFELESGVGDPNLLDADGNGIACQDFDYGDEGVADAAASATATATPTATAAAAQYQYGDATATALPATGGPVGSDIMGVTAALGLLVLSAWGFVTLSRMYLNRR